MLACRLISFRGVAACDAGSFCVKGFKVKPSLRPLVWQLMAGVLMLEAGLGRPSECPSTKEETESSARFDVKVGQL